MFPVRKRCALYTVIYPQMSPFLGAWYQSVERQTDQNFDLCISLDGLAPEDVARQLGHTPRATWLANHSASTPGQIRFAGIRQLLEDYDEILFVDSDDVLHPTRVEAARRSLRNSDVNGCGLQIMNERGSDLGLVFGLPAEETIDSVLPRWNVFGLSNTSYRVETLRACLPIPSECELVDWWLITRAWMMRAKLEFDPTPRMWYRQYGRNTAKVLPPFAPEEISRATQRVRTHYHLLTQAQPKTGGARWERVLAEQARVAAFQRNICEQPHRLALYADALNRLPVHFVWWWAVAHPMVEQLWKS
mgnify:CR=1 FL=1